MTNMTIIDDLLILFDDEVSRDLDAVSKAFSERSKQTLSSSIGRLTSKGLLERINGRRKYRISKEGRNFVTSNLNQIKLRIGKKWDGSWEQVIFNIPERDRRRRDELRKLLINVGYGRLHNTIWISPWSHIQEIKQFIGRTKSENNITVINTGKLDEAANKRIVDFIDLDWQTLEEDYKKFIESANQFLNNKSKTSFGARRIVYYYAKILTSDPKLPDELPQRVKSAKLARDLYEQIRPYCYEK